MKYIWKRQAVFLLALSLVAGTVPVTSSSFLMENIGIVANATDNDSFVLAWLKENTHLFTMGEKSFYVSSDAENAYTNEESDTVLKCFTETGETSDDWNYTVSQVLDEDIYYIITEKEYQILHPIKNINLVLGDEFGLNFYVNKSIVTDDAEYTMKFSGKCTENNQNIPLSEKNDMFFATAHIYANHMSEKITVTLCKDGNPVSEPVTYSVEDYLSVAENLPDNNEKTNTLIQATRNFGLVAEKYVKQEIAEISLPEPSREDYEKYKPNFTSEEATISLVLDSELGILLHRDGMDTPDSISGLKPVFLGKTQEIEDNGKTYRFSALSWVYRVLDTLSPDTQDSREKQNRDLAKALLAYYNSAIDYTAIDLSTLEDNYTAKNGDILTGKLSGNYQITVEDGASVILKDVVINGVDSENYNWAGITLLGNATLVLDGENTVEGFYQKHSGIYVPEEKTLTIEGKGKLNVSGGKFGAGIGGGYQINCGNIVIKDGTIIANGGGNSAGIGNSYKAKCGTIKIKGGTVTANGGNLGAGIGSGNTGTCDAIIIEGGTVTANGGNFGAGIGSGNAGTCDAITIKDTVTCVTASKKTGSPCSIGKGLSTNNSSTCGTITVGDKIYPDGITDNTFEYVPNKQ